MATITLYTKNLLETGDVHISGVPDAGYIKERLYDRAVSLFWKDTVTAAQGFYINLPDNILLCDMLAIEKHNFEAKDMKWQHGDIELKKDLSLETVPQSQIRSSAAITGTICLAGTGNNGQIWRTTDSGDTWTMVKDLSLETPAQTNVLSLVRITDTICLAGTNPNAQIWRSDDAGLTWTLVKDLSLETPAQDQVWSLERLSDTICFAGTVPNGQIWRSTDSGLTWALVKDLSLEIPAQTSISSFTRVSGNTLLAGTYPNAQVWRSNSSGISWVLVKDLSLETPSEERVLSLESLSSSICLAGTHTNGQIWRSTNGGVSWYLVKDLSLESPSQEGVIPLLKISETECIAGTFLNAQLWRSIDTGLTWHIIFDLSDETPSQQYIGAMCAPDQNTWLAGTLMNAQVWKFKWEDAAPSWTQVDNSQIIKTMSSGQVKDFWRVTVSSITNPMCSEIFMSKAYDFDIQATPSPEAVKLANVQWNKTVGGIERSTKFGDVRRNHQYTLLLNPAKLSEFKTAMDDMDHFSKPFYIKDHEGLFWMCRLMSEPVEIYTSNNLTHIMIEVIEML